MGYHFGARGAHQVMGGDVGIVAQKPEWWRVRFPPEDRRRGGNKLGDCELGGDYAALVVDAHKEAHGGVEDDPCCQENAPFDADAAKQERDAGEEEAGFLVGEEGE